MGQNSLYSLLFIYYIYIYVIEQNIHIQGVPKNIPNFKSHNIIMSARVYFMKRVKDCKDVSIMSPQGEQ